jgi:hypothetical protein
VAHVDELAGLRALERLVRARVLRERREGERFPPRLHSRFGEGARAAEHRSTRISNAYANAMKRDLPGGTMSAKANPKGVLSNMVHGWPGFEQEET